MPTLQNDLLLKALRGEAVERPPVWMMRQAGRFLPGFRALREKYDFFTRVETPELAAQITQMPVDEIGVDAAIIFSDILVVPQALGFQVTMNEGEGPRLPNPIRSVADVERIPEVDVAARLHYVMAALQLTRVQLAGRVPLIGFAGAPFTLMCYLVEGQGSKEFHRAKAFYLNELAAAHLLLEKLTQATIVYLNAQIAAGADVVQVFDSWAGLLSAEDFAIYALPYLKRIVEGVKGAPVILFAKGSWYALKELAATGAAALGVDWCTPADYARQTAGPHITLQGNFDPSHLLAPIPQIEAEVRQMLSRFGRRRYIANLGHGILPNVPVAHAQAFVNAVKAWRPE